MKKNNLSLVVIAVAMLVGGFLIGSMWKENQLLKKNAVPTAQLPHEDAPATPKPRDLTEDGLLAKAKEVGVKADELKKCLEDGATKQIVIDDEKNGKLAGVKGTPGTIIVVDGKPAELIPGALPFEQVKTMIDYYVDGGKIDEAKSVKVAGMPAINDKDHYLGVENAKITLVEYSDFECPFCSRFHPTMDQLMKEYEGQIARVFRNFPLSFHEHAQKAAEAAECVAQLKGNEAYWQYSDLLFTK